VVRDAGALAAAHGYSGHYLQDTMGDASERSPAELSPEFTKHFRALRIWLPLVLLGTRPFRDALDEKLLLARYFRAEVERLGFEVGPEPDLSVVTYRWVPPGASPEEVDRVNRRILDGIREDGRIFLSSTLIDGRFTLRMVALGFRTHLRTIDLALRLLAEHASAASA
jgi:aromatic-L-amino-acid decarboxylase